VRLITQLKKFSKTLKDYHKKHIESIDLSNIGAPEFLKISLYYSAQQSRTDYKLKQITNFDWLSMEDLEIGAHRLGELVLGNNLIFEESIEFRDCVYGEADCVDLDNKIIYEFKCTKDITQCHINQLAIYKLMFKQKYADFRFMIFNIFTGELQELINVEEGLIDLLINYKESNDYVLTDEEFCSEVGIC
jgi:hypothetical protein